MDHLTLSVKRSDFAFLQERGFLEDADQLWGALVSLREEDNTSSKQDSAGRMSCARVSQVVGLIFVELSLFVGALTFTVASWGGMVFAFLQVLFPELFGCFLLWKSSRVEDEQLKKNLQFWSQVCWTVTTLVCLPFFYVFSCAFISSSTRSFDGLKAMAIAVWGPLVFVLAPCVAHFFLSPRSPYHGRPLSTLPFYNGLMIFLYSCMIQFSTGTMSIQVAQVFPVILCLGLFVAGVAFDSYVHLEDFATFAIGYASIAIVLPFSILAYYMVQTSPVWALVLLPPLSVAFLMASWFCGRKLLLLDAVFVFVVWLVSMGVRLNFLWTLSPYVIPLVFFAIGSAVCIFGYFISKKSKNISHFLMQRLPSWMFPRNVRRRMGYDNIDAQSTVVTL